LYIIAVAGAESAIGLAILIAYFKIRKVPFTSSYSTYSKLLETTKRSISIPLFNQSSSLNKEFFFEFIKNNLN